MAAGGSTRAIQRRVREAVPIARVVHLEPDHPDTGRDLADELGPGSASAT